MCRMVNVIGKEIGNTGGIRPITDGKKKSYEVEPLELNDELRFPQSIPIYDAMRSQDGQVGSVMSAIVLPLVSANWDLRTNGVRAEVANFIRNELGLVAPDDALARTRRNGIVWRDHLETAAETMLWSGFCAFEQVYEVTPAGPDDEYGLNDVIHLRKLGQRLPRTITQIEVAADGGLKAIHQAPADGSDKDVVIPVERILYYTLRREGADWSGRSILRQAYKHWLLKDGFMRLDAQAAERNSMGIPVIYYHDAEQKQAAEQAVKDYRAGATAGLVLPDTCKIEIMGISGSVTDLVERMKYHDQQIALSALAQFLNLGHDGGLGSGMIGQVHLGVFLSSVQSLAESIASIATEHLIRDLVELNYGPDEPYPLLTPGKIANEISVESLKALVDAGVVVPDDKLEAFMRTKTGLPEADKATSRTPPAPQPTAQTSRKFSQNLDSDSHDAELQELLQRTLELRQRAKHV